MITLASADVKLFEYLQLKIPTTVMSFFLEISLHQLKAQA